MATSPTISSADIDRFLRIRSAASWAGAWRCARKTYRKIILFQRGQVQFVTAADSQRVMADTKVSHRVV